MGNLPSSRRNSRISQNPNLVPGSRIVPPPPGPAGYPPSAAPHMPYYYPPNYNGAMPAPQFFHQSIPTNGHYLMSLPPPQGFRAPPGSLPPPSNAPPPLPPRTHASAGVENQKANTIQNDVNLKKATLRLERDEENPGYFLVAFSFDTTVAGSICIFFLAREGPHCSLTALKPNIYMPVRTQFEKGLGQKFRQAPGTGVMLALFDDTELSKGEDNVYPLVVRMETVPRNPPVGEQSIDDKPLEAPLPDWVHSQTTQAVIEKKDDETYEVRVMKQIIWVGGVRYELQEIYGIDNSGVGSNPDGTDAGKECVVCMSEPRDTTVLPCRHMCMCSECAKVLRFQTNRCPICRTPVERLLEIKVPRIDSVDQEAGRVESNGLSTSLGPKYSSMDKQGAKVESTSFGSNLGPTNELSNQLGGRVESSSFGSSLRPKNDMVDEHGNRVESSSFGSTSGPKHNMIHKQAGGVVESSFRSSVDPISSDSKQS